MSTTADTPAAVVATAPRRLTALLLRHLRSAPKAGLGETVRLQLQRYDRTIVVLRAFYALSFVWTVQSMGGWVRLRDTEVLEPLWPAFWVDGTNPGTGISIILYSFLVASLAAMCFPWSRLLRLAYVATLAQYLAVFMAFGKINHNYHAWVWTAALFVLLPTARGFRRADAAARHQTLAVVWAAQLMVLFFYTLTGLWKLAYSLRALTTSTISGLELDGFSLILADRLMRTNQETMLGVWLVDRPLIGWLLYNGTMYLETASILIAFRPRLHRAWGVGLVLFHLGTMLAMGFTFMQNLALLGLLFVCSPFAPDRVDLRATVADLPGVRLLVRTWQRVGRAGASV